jgi:hypothetical protein
MMVMLALAAACSRQTLVAVAACPDGGGRFASCAPDTGALRMGLVGLWHLDETTGATAFDSSGLATPNNGTLKDLDPSAAWVEGQIGGALETKGLGYVVVPRSPSIDTIRSQVTVAAWVYLEGTIVDYGTAISRQIGTGIDQYYHLALNGGSLPSGFISRTVPNLFYRQVLADADDPVPPMTWTHLAVTYDGSNARLYVDGTQAKVLPVTGMFGDETNPLIIGGNENEGIIDERFPGRIDEIVLYNRALLPDEVSMLASGAVF